MMITLIKTTVTKRDSKDKKNHKTKYANICEKSSGVLSGKQHSP